MVYSVNDNPGLIKVLSFLKTHNTEYLSGQDLSDVLKISRVAVWKHIKKIKELGYEVESIQKQGYR
ncbi:MAG: HTH domain-containing protein, partial [Candidatus Nitrosomaritimum aestuariumsis]